MSGPKDKFLISAPGKVILFGEHAVVYNKPAIAASVDVRQYLLVSPSRQSDLMELDFPDIGFAQEWKIGDLPWDCLDPQYIENELNTLGHDHILNEALEQKLKSLIKEIDCTDAIGLAAYYAAFSFLYLYMHVCTKDMAGKRFSVRSLIPVSAGLGSSAALSVCLSTSMLILRGIIENPNDPETFNKKSCLDLISKWSFVGEVCIHGRPSGIDNAVATRGGAVLFQRPNTLKPFAFFPPLKLVLTDTKQPRSTATLVASVRKLKEELPEIVDLILESIGQISKKAAKLIEETPESATSGVYSSDIHDISIELSKLIHMNHALLSSLGVSHHTLESVKSASDEIRLGETKLTGSGGGGCAITLVDYEGYHKNVDEHERKVELLRKKLPENYKVFESVLGGPGVAYGSLQTDITWKEFVKLRDVQQFHELATWKHW